MPIQSRKNWEEKHMSIILQIVSIAVCLLMLYGLCQEMKKRHLSENQAILWIAGGGGPPAAFHISTNTAMGCRASGNLVAPASLIFFFLIVIIMIILRHTVTISSNGTEIKELAMQVALLKDENSELENMLNSKTKGENTNI